MRGRLIVAAIWSMIASPAVWAAPIGQWFFDYGQGNFSYAIYNDSAGSDSFEFYDTTNGLTGGGVGISVRVGGVSPLPYSTVIVTIGGDEWQLPVDREGGVPTDCHVCAANFDDLWDHVRKGAVMRVRLSTGQSTRFTLAGAAKVLGRRPPKADFYK